MAVVRDCVGAWLDSGAFGNIVTGNGTSTAVCPVRAQAEQFVYFQAWAGDASAAR